MGRKCRNLRGINERREMSEGGVAKRDIRPKVGHARDEVARGASACSFQGRGFIL